MALAASQIGIRQAKSVYVAGRRKLEGCFTTIGTQKVILIERYCDSKKTIEIVLPQNQAGIARQLFDMHKKRIKKAWRAERSPKEKITERLQRQYMLLRAARGG